MQPRILVVDDETVVLSSMEKLLSIGPYTVLSALSGHEGLEVLAREWVDLVISDERMPGMSGAEFLSIVRKRHPQTVRIMLTGYASLTTAIRAINEGEIFRFLTKPIRGRELHDVVRDALAHKLKHGDACNVQNLFHDLEKQAPGITRVKRDADGAVIINGEEDV